MLSLGEANQTTLYKAWNSNLMKELRELHTKGEWYKNDVCKMCVELSYPKAKEFVIQDELSLNIVNE